MKSINNDSILFDEIAKLIEHSRKTIYKQASATTVLLFWKIGQCINNDILENKRAMESKLCRYWLHN